MAETIAVATEALQTHPKSSLYVGDLDQSVNETQLLDLFNQIATVQTVRVCRDVNHRSLGYAYVNFTNPNDAIRAMDTLNYTPIRDRPIRIMLSNRDPSTRLSGKDNVFVKNLDLSIDNKALFDTFSCFGAILSCKVAADASGKWKGYGFVQFEKEETAQAAIDKLNGMLLNDKQVFVGHFVRRRTRGEEGGEVPRFTNVYVKNLPKDITDDELKKTFGKFGEISSAVVMKDESGSSRCFGFVNFESFEAAAVAVEKMNGISLGEDVLYVGKAQKKSEREDELRRKFEQDKISRFEKLQGSNLYLKNIDDSVNDEKLKEMFSEYGSVTSCKVMINAQGLSKGFGFVAYSKPEEALRAVNEMNGKMIGKKPLYIAVAQRKEERRNHLKSLFAHMRPNGSLSSTPSPMPRFHHHPPGGPMSGPHNPMYIGQNGQGVVPYQLQFMPGVRPGAGPGNFIMPYPLQRQIQPGPRVGFRRDATNMQQHFQQQQQILQQNARPGMRYMGGGPGNMRNGMEPSGLQGIMSSPLDASAISHIDTQQPQKPPLLPSALALANPDSHPQILGEQLYPLVNKHEPVHAAKVTGMLLEMDQAEILHLLESPEALKAKVSEALDVLSVSSANPTDVSSLDHQSALTPKE
ncbi:unnamed protein product [Cochlearia groenlandica]